MKYNLLPVCFRRRDLDVFGAPGLPDAGPFVALTKTTSLSLKHHNTENHADTFHYHTKFFLIQTND